MTGPAPILRADEAGIERAAETIRTGGIIAYPTETVYGLGADPFRAEAVDRVFAIKERAALKALILLVRGEADLEGLTEDVPAAARDLIRAFWPGPLTLVFRARAGLPERLLGGGGTIALRYSDAPIAQRLLARVGGPITSTSANRSGESAARSAREADRALGDRVDLILDGGPSGDARPSTVVDVSTGTVRVLREGRIPSGLVLKEGMSEGCSG